MTGEQLDAIRARCTLGFCADYVLGDARDLLAEVDRLRSLLAEAPELGPWRCFHCGEVFTDAESAAVHFGPESAEWPAGCIDLLTRDETERRAEMIQLHSQLDAARDEVAELVAEVDSLRAKLTHAQNAYFQLSKEIEQVLGTALGYPRYCDDPENWPDATPEDGVCVGENVPEVLAMEAARALGAAQVAVEKWIKWRDTPSEAVLDADFEAWTGAMDDLARALVVLGAQEVKP